ncbi:MAG: hypothetical protein HC945_02040 [Nitrosarchaeum sp.]|nr:hypothetical protein [Nitrosarchaeum sp.]
MNSNGSAPDAVSTNHTLATITEGTHQILLGARDNAENSANSTPITIRSMRPCRTSQLVTPLSGAEVLSADVLFNYTVTDNIDALLNCTLYVSGEPDVGSSVPNGSWSNYTHLDMAYGLHYWNVTCRDDAGNLGVSELRNFTVPAPDLMTNASYISFSVNNSTEDDNVTINATILNIGDSTATTIIVQAFLGDPDMGALQIGNNQTIASLAPGQNQTLTFNHTTRIGANHIYIVIDPPLASNGTIAEQDETNNKAYRTLTIGLFEFFLGNASAVLRVTDQIYSPVFLWDIENATGGHILVADEDSIPDLASLHAIGRDLTNNVRFEDFAEIDAALNASTFTDSINITYTASGTPKQVTTFTLFKEPILNVPVVNSTSSDQFLTGILWDTSDGGTQYNATQDLVFVTELGDQILGPNGIVDFEIRVPATLRSYTAGGNTVAFYAELP